MLRRILLTALLALPALAADITGSWSFAVDIGGQSGTPKFTFQQKGETLTGTYAGQLGESKLTGTVKGDDVSFQFEASGIKIIYIGKITSPATMKGQADFGGQAEGAWTAKKD